MSENGSQFLSVSSVCSRAILLCCVFYLKLHLRIMQQLAPVLFSDCRWYTSAVKMHKSSRHQRPRVVLIGLTSIATSITRFQQLKKSRIVNEVGLFSNDYKGVS